MRRGRFRRGGGLVGDERESLRRRRDHERGDRVHRRRRGVLGARVSRLRGSIDVSQCSHVGLEAECSVSSGRRRVELGRHRRRRVPRSISKRARVPRRKILDPVSALERGARRGASDGVPDTVTQFGDYPSMEAFDRAAASRGDHPRERIRHQRRRAVRGGAPSATRGRQEDAGIPHDTSGSTSRRAEWPYPHIQDECRGPVDLQSGAAVSPSSSSITAPRSTRCSACACAGRRFPPSWRLPSRLRSTSVVRFSVDSGTQDITLTFLPGKNPHAIRGSIRVHDDRDRRRNVRRVLRRRRRRRDDLGDYQLKKPELTRGSAGFETEPLSSGAAVTVTLAATGTSHAVTLVSATVRAANPAQVSRGFPPYAGYEQTTCGAFESGRCGT